jgi:hypothetical protein
MKRFGLGLALAASLLFVVPLTVGGCNISCACTTTPDPNWTPPPKTTQDAVTAVAKFAAGTSGTEPTGLEAVLANQYSDHPIFEVSGPTVDGVADGKTGVVLEWLLVASLPDSTDVAISDGQAEATATSFIRERNIDTTGLTATSTLRPGGATSEYVVTWVGPVANSPGFSVFINPSTGAAFAFADQRFGVQMVPPSIGAAAAGRLAIATVSTPGEVVLSTDFQFNYEAPTWEVQLATPSATASAEPEHWADVSVDAVTGTVTVSKSV